MALKAVRISDVPCGLLDNTAPLIHPPAVSSTPRQLHHGVGEDGGNPKLHGVLPVEKFVVMGHRGNGMNMLQSSDRRMKCVKENSLASFKAATEFPVDFIEFDVQVTSDGCPIIFHDNFIFYQHKGEIIEKRVTDMTLEEFLSHGPQGESKDVDKPLYRKTKDGRIFEWKVEHDAPFCTLQEVFENVNMSVGFNIELKFDDQLVYNEPDLARILGATLRVVHEYAKDRLIMFSSFQPDAALLIRKLQSTYPVFFLTNGGSEIFSDVRRNSLDEAIKVCHAGGLQGIVSEVKAVLRNPGTVPRIIESNLTLLSYGQLNNVPEVVYIQHLMGVKGVIVDFLFEVTAAVSDFIGSSVDDEEGKDHKGLPGKSKRDGEAEAVIKPRFSQHELSFLLKLIPELIQSSSH